MFLSSVVRRRSTRTRPVSWSPSYLWSIPRQIWRHPNNRNRRSLALARSILWQAYKRLVGKPITVRLFGTLRLRCYPDSVGASSVIYFGDYYEFNEMHFVRRFLRPGDSFIDGGANIGTYSLLAASIVGSSGRVIAFEPDPIAASRFRENIALNGFSNIAVHEAALSDSSGVMRFSDGLDVSNRMVAPTETGVPTVEVEAVRLDDHLERDVAYLMAKFDLEGSELAALHGAEEHLLAGNPPVWQLEATEGQLQKQGASRHDVISFLRDCGYEFASYDARVGRLSFLDTVTPAHHDFFAVHPSARDLVLQRLNSRRH
jgi:FkbM family methyltransferase